MYLYNSIAELAEIVPFTHDEIIAATLFFFYVYDLVRAAFIGGIAFGVFVLLDKLVRKLRKRNK